MINPFAEVNWHPGTADKRRFAVSLIIGFPCLAAVWLVIGRLTTGSWATLTMTRTAGWGAAVGAVLWLLPVIAWPFYAAWYAISCSIGIVVSNTLMVAFYYLVLTPVALLLRAVRPAGFRRRLDRSIETYWHTAEPPRDPARYYNQF